MHRLLTLCLCALLLTATGCGGSSTSAGWVEESVGQLVVQRPQSWQPGPEVEQPWTDSWAGDGMTMQVSGQFSDDVGAYAGLARLDLPATVQLPDYQPESTDEITVEGAYDAVVRRYSYTDDGRPRQGAWIVASQWPEPLIVVVSLSGETLDAEIVQKVQESMQLVQGSP